MIEKYAVDPSVIEPSADQLEELAKLNPYYEMPKTAKEAVEMITKYAAEKR